MEAEEIRAEIERRKKRARDIGIRELIWKFYSRDLRPFLTDIKKDPELILPELRDGLDISEHRFIFEFSGSRYILRYEDGPREHKGHGFGSTTITPVTISFFVGEQQVLRFKMRRIVESGEDMPCFRETMGEIEAYIEGAWIEEIARLDKKFTTHRSEIRAQRQAPRIAEKLRIDMTNFGL